MGVLVILSLVYVIFTPSVTAIYTLIGTAAIIYLIFYAFKAVALSEMARRAGKEKLVWCAFVPFASSYLMGTLAGECRLGSFRIKKFGIIVLIAELVNFLALLFYYLPLLLGYLFSWVEFAENNSGFSLQIVNMPLWANIMYNTGKITSILFGVIYSVISVMLYLFLFRRYAPASYIWLTIFCVFIPFAFPFLLFAFRKRKPVTCSAYMYDRTVSMPSGHQEGRDEPSVKKTTNMEEPFSEYQESDTEKSKDQDPFSEF